MLILLGKYENYNGVKMLLKMISICNDPGFELLGDLLFSELHVVDIDLLPFFR